MKLRLIAFGSLALLCGIASVIYANVKDEALDALSHISLPRAERTAVYRCDNSQSIEAGFAGNRVGLTVSDGRTFLLSQTASAMVYENAERSELFRLDGVKATLSVGTGEFFDNCILNDALDEQVPKGEQEGQVAMINLIALGKPIQCSIRQTSGSDSATGTVHAHKHSLRADFMSPPSPAGQTKMHIISDGQYAYAWEDGNTLGMRFNLLALAEEQANARAAGMLPPDPPIRWNCNEWDLEESAFQPPSSVYFSESPIPPLGMFWML